MESVACSLMVTVPEDSPGISLSWKEEEPPSTMSDSDGLITATGERRVDLLRLRKVRVTSVFRPGRMGVRTSLRLTSTVGAGAESDSFSEGSGSAAEGAAGLAGEASGSAA